MDVRLVVEQGGRRKVVRLTSAKAILGRGRDSTIRIPSAEVSRQHCKLLYKDGLLRVEDLESVNGTLLNGKPVDGVELVRPGDRLVVGPVTFVVEYELTPDALERLRREAGEDVELLTVDGAEEEEEVTVGVEAEGEEDDLLDPGFDFEEAWQPPQGEDLRDLLSQMEDEEEKPAEKPKKKKPR